MSWDAIVEIMMEAVKCKGTVKSVPVYVDKDDGRLLICKTWHFSDAHGAAIERHLIHSKEGPTKDVSTANQMANIAEP